MPVSLTNAPTAPLNKKEELIQQPTAGQEMMDYLRGVTSDSIPFDQLTAEEINELEGSKSPYRSLICPVLLGLPRIPVHIGRDTLNTFCFEELCKNYPNLMNGEEYQNPVNRDATFSLREIIPAHAVRLVLKDACRNMIEARSTAKRKLLPYQTQVTTETTSDKLTIKMYPSATARDLGLFSDTSFQAEVNQFVSCVMRGNQNEAEAMLKKNPKLALGKSYTVADHSNRRFRNITGFQYALWALDWHMWEMILPYLNQANPQAAAEQCREQEQLTSAQGEGAHYNYQKLEQVLEDYLLLCDDLHKKIIVYKTLKSSLFKNSKKAQDQKDTAERACITHWVRRVGGAQKEVPAHVAQEYCHPDRSFFPIPDFHVKSFTRQLHVKGGESWWTVRYFRNFLGEAKHPGTFTPNLDETEYMKNHPEGALLGSAITRGEFQFAGGWWSNKREDCCCDVGVKMDLAALKQLFLTRSSQLREIQSQFPSSTYQSLLI